MKNESGFLETNGASIYHEVEGTGEAVVLIHAGVANLRMWDDQVAALRDSYRVIRYDTRGFGRTETEAVEFSNRADVALAGIPAVGFEFVDRNKTGFVIDHLGLLLERVGGHTPTLRPLPACPRRWPRGNGPGRH